MSDKFFIDKTRQGNPVCTDTGVRVNKRDMVKRMNRMHKVIGNLIEQIKGLEHAADARLINKLEEELV